jgi:hypothetical protein
MNAPALVAGSREILSGFGAAKVYSRVCVSVVLGRPSDVGGDACPGYVLALRWRHRQRKTRRSAECLAARAGNGIGEEDVKGGKNIERSEEQGHIISLLKHKCGKQA